MKNNDTTALLVGFDCTNGKDHAVLIVGKKQKNDAVDIINAFQGKEAIELYEKLITKTGLKNQET